MPRIIPIRELKNTTAISEMCHSTNEPVFISRNGYDDMVVMSMSTYEDLFKKLELYKELALSERDFENGRQSDAYAALAELRTKHGL